MINLVLVLQVRFDEADKNDEQNYGSYNHITGSQRPEKIKRCDQDAFSILRGGNTAATDYLRAKTTDQLTVAFKPITSRSLNNTNATKYWSDVFTAYNRFSRTPVNTDLTAYVTQKALDGLFYKIGVEEQQIRQDPAARVKDILKKVFSQQSTASAF